MSVLQNEIRKLWKTGVWLLLPASILLFFLLFSLGLAPLADQVPSCFLRWIGFCWSSIHCGIWCVVSLPWVLL